MATTIETVTHHTIAVHGADLHYVSAGATGSPVLLVHGFPETWWAFRDLIPLVAARHRVFAVDLRGFGDSSPAADDFDSARAAEDLHLLIDHLGVGPVHLLAQDIAGGTAFRLGATQPADLLSFIAVEMGLAGFGLEAFADVVHGGSWHIGVLATPGIPELLFTGREREVIGDWAFPAMTIVRDAITAEDVDEFARTYARPGGWKGAIGLYRSMLAEGDELRSLAESCPLSVPVLAIGAFTYRTLCQVSRGDVTAVELEGVGHYAVQEAPDQVAEALLRFTRSVDGGPPVA